MTMVTEVAFTPDWRARLSKAPEGHKYSHGSALVLAGGAGRGGAARLAARAALRVGAGLVTLGCPADAMAENAARLDAVMLRQIGNAAELANFLADPRVTAVCLGPNLGLDERARGLVREALSAGRRVVLDADGLSAFAAHPESLLTSLHPGVVITPHAGEFGRLFPDLAAGARGAEAERLAVARTAAARANAVVLLKGRDTILAHPDGRCAITRGERFPSSAWLATAGSGDVLAGLVAGLAARGFPPFEAACLGAWLHLAAANAVGPGLVAEDLPEAIPLVFRAQGVT